MRVCLKRFDRALKRVQLTELRSRSSRQGVARIGVGLAAPLPFSLQSLSRRSNGCSCGKAKGTLSLYFS